MRNADLQIDALHPPVERPLHGLDPVHAAILPHLVRTAPSDSRDINYRAMSGVLATPEGSSRIRSIRTESVAREADRSDGRRQRVRARILTPFVQSRSGLALVTLSSAGRQRRHYVCKLQAAAFGERKGGGASEFADQQ